ncbi:MAG: Adenosine deaminase, partial [uncultured Friedmanniella sp.]
DARPGPVALPAAARAAKGLPARPPRRRAAPGDGVRDRHGHRAPAARRQPGSAGPLVRRVGQLGFAGALPGDLRTHRRGDAEGSGPASGRPGVRRGPGRRRRGVRRGALGARAAHPGWAQRGRGRGGGPRRAAGGDGRLRRPGPAAGGAAAAHLHAARAADDPDRRAGAGLPRPGGGRLRPRGGRGRFPGGALPARLPAAEAGRLPVHDPRRRGGGRRLDPGRGAGLQRQPDRPRGTDRRRHRDRCRRHRPAGPAGVPRPRLAAAAGALPVVERPDRGGALAGGPPLPLPRRARLPGHRQLRQPADERDLADSGVRRPGGAPGLRPDRPAPGHPERRRQRLSALAPPRGPDRRRDPAGLRRRPGL